MQVLMLLIAANLTGKNLETRAQTGLHSSSLKLAGSTVLNIEQTRDSSGLEHKMLDVKEAWKVHPTIQFPS